LQSFTIQRQRAYFRLLCRIFAKRKTGSGIGRLFDFFEMEFAEMVRDVPTRWLSSFQAIDRLLMSWPAVKCYFLKQGNTLFLIRCKRKEFNLFYLQGEENCDPVIWQFIGQQTDELLDDITECTLPELHIHFTHHYLHLMTQTILVLESNHVTSMEIFDVMENLKASLAERIDKKFFGATAGQNLKTQSNYQRSKFTEMAISVYRRTLEYIDEWYDDMPFRDFRALNLRNRDKLKYKKVLKATESACVTVEADKLFDEIICINRVLPQIKKEFAAIPLDKLWVEVLKKGETLSETERVVSKIMSVPISNAFPERVFSMMGYIWSDDRSQLRPEVVKAELATKINFEMKCHEFVNFIKEPDQNHILKCVSNQSKYNFKK
jgi:hypothetical protein